MKQLANQLSLLTNSMRNDLEHLPLSEGDLCRHHTELKEVSRNINEGLDLIQQVGDILTELDNLEAGVQKNIYDGVRAAILSISALSMWIEERLVIFSGQDLPETFTNFLNEFAEEHATFNKKTYEAFETIIDAVALLRKAQKGPEVAPKGNELFN